MRTVNAGERFGKRVVLGDAGPGGNGSMRVRVQCDCGKRGVVYAFHLLKGGSRQCASCGGKEAAAARYSELKEAKSRIAELVAENARLVKNQNSDAETYSKLSGVIEEVQSGWARKHGTLRLLRSMRAMAQADTFATCIDELTTAWNSVVVPQPSVDESERANER